MSTAAADPPAGARASLPHGGDGSGRRGRRGGASPVFFRDPGAFRALAGLLPPLFRGKDARDAVRVWIAGCATGEEAYSIAILLTEHAATLPHPPSLQMFATDLEETGYVQGRDALYPAASVRELTVERLGRFFVREREGYRVAPPLREAVLFAQHDVLLDPPFARLDLVSCRTLLGGMPGEARTQVMGTFHDALVPGGLLFLGTAGDADGDARFVATAGEQCIYRRAGGPPRRTTRDEGSRA